MVQPNTSSSSNNLLLLSVANLDPRSNNPGSNTSGASKGQIKPVSGDAETSPKTHEEQISDREESDQEQDNFSLKSGQYCHTSYSLLSGNSSGAESLTSAEAAPCDTTPSDPVIMTSEAVSPATSSPLRRDNNNDLKSKVTSSSPVAAPSDLAEQLAEARALIKQKDEDIERLSRIRGDVEAEVEDLTASLFEEAHKMVREANVKQASAEKMQLEANMKIEGLETEVAALKTLVLTSTPSQPNKHLHPQLDTKRSGKRNNSSSSSSSPSSSKSNSLGRGLVGIEVNGTIPASTSFNGGMGPNSLGSIRDDEVDGEDAARAAKSIDPVLRAEYLAWWKAPTLDRSHSPFLQRIYAEDIDLCLEFVNRDLAKDVLAAIEGNTLCLTPVKDFSTVPRNCSLLDSPLLCKFSLRLSERGGEDHFVSQLARNRIAAVCDCVTYLRYIVQGLVKSHVNDVYWEVMHLRRKMTLARLGFTPE